MQRGLKLGGVPKGEGEEERQRKGAEWTETWTE